MNDKLDGKRKGKSVDKEEEVKDVISDFRKFQVFK